MQIKAQEALFRGFHLQSIIEAIEIVKQPDGGQQFYDFAFIKVFAHFIPQLIVYGMGIARDALGQPQRGFFFCRKICALFEVSQAVDLIVCPAMPPCQDGVGGQSIFAAVDLRGADNQQLFQLRGDRAGFHYGLKMRHHRPHNLRSMSDRAEHIGNVAARLHERIVNFCDFW